MNDAVSTGEPSPEGALARSTADVLQELTGGLSVAVMIVTDAGVVSLSLRSDTSDALRMARTFAETSSKGPRPDCYPSCGDAHDRLRQAALLFKPEAGKS